MGDTGAIVIMMGMLMGVVVCIFVGPLFITLMFSLVKYLLDKKDV